jgi:hypothetical protein
MAESYLQLEAQRTNLRLQLRTLNEDYQDLKKRHDRLQESLGWAVQVIGMFPVLSEYNQEQFEKAGNLLYMEEVLDEDLYS